MLSFEYLGGAEKPTSFPPKMAGPLRQRAVSGCIHMDDLTTKRGIIKREGKMQGKHVTLEIFVNVVRQGRAEGHGPNRGQGPGRDLRLKGFGSYIKKGEGKLPFMMGAWTKDCRHSGGG